MKVYEGLSGEYGNERVGTLRSSWSIMTLCGFTSLCIIPFEWQKSRAWRPEMSRTRMTARWAYFEKLEHIETDVHVGESRIKNFEVHVVDVFCNSTLR